MAKRHKNHDGFYERAADETPNDYTRRLARYGQAFLNLTILWEEFDMPDSTLVIKRISVKRSGRGWLYTLAAKVDGHDKVQFCYVDVLPQGPEALTNLLKSPNWKDDEFAATKSAP